MFQNLVQNSWSKKFVVVLALSIGTMPLQMLAVPKSARALPKQTAQAKKVEQNKKTEIVDKGNQELHKVITAIIQDPSIECFIENYYTVVLYGPGAKAKAEQVKLIIKKAREYLFSIYTVIGFEGEHAKEEALKYRENLREQARRDVLMSKWIGGMSIAIGSLIILLVTGHSIWNNRDELFNPGAQRIQVQADQLAQDRLHIVPVAESIHQGILQDWQNDFAYARNMLVGNPGFQLGQDMGQVLRNEVVQNARLYGRVSQEQFQQSQNRIYDLQLIARHRNILPENALQTLIREFPDDIAMVGFYHLRNNRFNRIIQMPQIIRNFLVDAMTERHIESLGNLYDTLRQGWGNVHRPALPEREVVHGIMVQRMNNIMANAQREE